MSLAVNSRPFIGALSCQLTPSRMLKTKVLSSGMSQLFARWPVMSSVSTLRVFMSNVFLSIAQS